MNNAISVIIPCYKAADTLRRAVDSVLDGAPAGLQLILVEDGSPDETGALCDTLAAGDARITALHRQNGGASAARNTSSTKTLTLVKLQLYDKAFSVLNLQGTIFVGMILLLILINLGYVFHMRHRIHKPLHKLSEAFAGVERGDFSIRIHHARDMTSPGCSSASTR